MDNLLVLNVSLPQSQSPFSQETCTVGLQSC